MNNLKLITIPDYLLLVDTEEENPPNKSFMYLPKYKKIVKFFSEQQVKEWEDAGERVTERDEEGFYIIAHLPLNNSSILEGVYLLPELPKQEESAHEIKEVIKRMGESGEIDDKFWPNLSAGFYYAFIKGYKAASKKWDDEDMIDFHLATTTTKHPLYSSYKQWIRENYNNWSPESLMEWYRKNKTPISPIGFEPEYEFLDDDLVPGDSTKILKIINGVLQGKFIYL